MRAHAWLACCGFALGACWVGSEPEPIETTVEGTIDLVAIDHTGVPDDGNVEGENPLALIEETVVYLNTDDGRVLELELDGVMDTSLFDTGDRVVIKGTMMASGDRILRVETSADVEIVERPPVLAAAGISQTRKLAVVLFNFSNDTSQPITAAYAKERLFTAETSADEFLREASYGQVKLVGSADVTGDVFGWYTIADQDDDCDTAKWRQLATTAATNAGKNLTGYAHVMFVFPGGAQCDWAGLGSIGGTWTLVKANSMGNRVPAHEIGHNLGLSHGSSYACTNATGGHVTLSDTCTTSEYGDSFDTMGGIYRHFSAYQKARLGWLATSQIRTLNTAGTYTVDVAPLGMTTTATQVLRVYRANKQDYYYVEFRQPTPVFDNWPDTHAAVNGLMIRIATDTTTRVAPKLLDMSPSTTTGTSFSDPTLPVGATYTDTASGISIQLVSRTTAGARVKVVIGTVTAPAPDTTPPTVTVTAPAAGGSVTGSVALTATASDNLGVTKVVFYSGSTVVATDTMTPYTAVWNSASVADGPRSITAKAYDAAGNITTSAAISVTVDNAVPAAELLTNGGFEDGSVAPWTKTGNAYYTTGAYPHTGEGYSYLGAAQNAVGTLAQQITIPAGGARALRFWLNVTTQETSITGTYDRLYVEILDTTGTLLKTLGTFNNRDATFNGDYIERSFSLADFAGQTVVLQFRATTDVSNTTWFRIDDVSTL
jgi:M6 family metalloprotease-like protein